MPDLRNLVVAIDGPSGSGKSTVARGVARALGLRYLDTGAMYRALTWLVLERGVDPTDPTAVAALSRSADIDVSTDPDHAEVRADGADVTAAIRGALVTAAVSAVSAVPDVRSDMVRRQQAVIGPGGIVVEGRDIGTTVAPDAPVKIFLTAHPAARAARRGAELGATATDPSTVAATEQDLLRRDTADRGRAVSPLAQANNAIVVDSTDLDADAVIARVLDEVRAVAPA